MALRRRGPRGQRGGHDLFPGFTDVYEIGVGSLAVVFRAREIGTNRQVALKLLNVRDASPRSIESFERESIALGALSSHPNIVTLYRTFRTPDGRPVLVLELCSGAVADRLHNGAGLPVPDVVSIGVKIAGALETAHRGGILHRDVKPQNILVTEFGEPALADFGVAMLQSSTQTTAGLFDFTTLHAAPELLEGSGTSAATDVYELASSLYQLIAGQSAFRAYEGESPASVILRILRDPVRPLSGMDVPMALSDLLIQAMSKEKDDRPPTAAEFAAELAAVEIDRGWNRTQFLIRDPGPPGTGLAPAITRMPDAVPRGLPSTLLPSGPTSHLTPVGSPQAFQPAPQPAAQGVPAAPVAAPPAAVAGPDAAWPGPPDVPHADDEPLEAPPQRWAPRQPQPVPPAVHATPPAVAAPAAPTTPAPTTPAPAAGEPDWSAPTIVPAAGWTPPPASVRPTPPPPGAEDGWWSPPPAGPAAAQPGSEPPAATQPAAASPAAEVPSEAWAPPVEQTVPVEQPGRERGAQVAPPDWSSFAPPVLPPPYVPTAAAPELPAAAPRSAPPAAAVPEQVPGAAAPARPHRVPVEIDDDYFPAQPGSLHHGVGAVAAPPAGGVPVDSQTVPTDLPAEAAAIANAAQPAPAPAMPAPATPAPATPAPATPAPVTPAPVTPAPVTPASPPPGRYPVPEAAGVPQWAVRAPVPDPAIGPQFISDLSLDPMSLRRKASLRAGASAVTVDEQHLRLRTWFSRSEIPWSAVHGFEANLDDADQGPAATGHIVALTTMGPVELPGTRRPVGELRYVHALLDAYRIKALRLAAGR